MISSSRINSLVRGLADELDKAKPLTFIRSTPTKTYTAGYLTDDDRDRMDEILGLPPRIKVEVDMTVIEWIENK